MRGSVSTGGRRLGALEAEVFGGPYGEDALAMVLVLCFAE